MDKDYKKRTADELLTDDFFIHSHLDPTLTTSHFWKEQIVSGLDKQTYDQAVLFLRTVKGNIALMPEERQERLWKRILESNKAPQLGRGRRLRFFSIAACLAILMVSAISYLYIYKDKTPDVEAIALSMAAVPKADEVQLVLPDQQIPISGQDSKIQHDSKGSIVVNSAKITEFSFVSPKSKKRPIDFNQLIVPDGKRSTLIFEDGTKLWVNAGSRIVYPVSFARDKREIYVDGEVFLEVTPDKVRPFVVKTKDMSVRVLGTSFNVMSYAKDHSSSVVLVTGSVEVGTKDNGDFKLTPNNMFSCHDGDSNVKEVNVNDYISWKEGLYTYKSENLSVILDRLSRYYGKKVNYQPEVASVKCSGKLDMQEDLDVLLGGLAKAAKVKYEKTGEEYLFSKIEE